MPLAQDIDRNQPARARHSALLWRRLLLLLLLLRLLLRLLRLLPLLLLLLGRGGARRAGHGLVAVVGQRGGRVDPFHEAAEEAVVVVAEALAA